MFNIMKFMFFTISLFSFIMMIMISKNMKIIFMFTMLELNSAQLNLEMMVDWKLLSLVSIVSFITGSIMIYSNSYMKKDKNNSQFIFMMSLFAMSMILMSLSKSNYMFMLIGWDFLGLTSLLLIIHYQSKYVFSFAMSTFIINRLGDISFIIAGAFMFNSGSWSIFSLTSSFFIIMIIMSIAGFTKSAQIPFSTWLPKAMAAPTPVSALVHSSTLVTAGVILIIQFDSFFMYKEIKFMFMMISILTMLISSFAAMTENDMKKIIAYSTMSQISFMMMIINMGNSELAFFHLMTHAIFKSLMFMTAGTIIFHSNGEQDIRMINNISKKLPLDCIVMNFSLMALMGFPFYSGFYSKDLIIEFFLVSNMNYMLMLMIYLSIFSTSIYAMRLSFYICWNNKYKINLSKWMSNPEEKKILFIFIIPVLSSGSMIMWNFYSNFYMESSIHLIKKSIGVWAMILSIIISMKIIQSHNNYNKMKFFYVNIFYLENFIFFLMNMSTLLCNWYLMHWENMWIKFISIKMILEMKQMLSYKNLFSFYSLMKFTIFISLLIIIIY